MNGELEKALAECLSRLEAGEDIESCLRGRGDQAEQLRPLLEAAAAVRRLPVEPYSPQAFQAGRARLRASLAAGRAQRPPVLGWPWLPRSAALLGAAALVALVALLAVSTDPFRFGTSTTEARVEGVVESVEVDGLLIRTRSGELSRIGLSDKTAIIGPAGQAWDLQDIPQGASVRIRVDEDDDDGDDDSRTAVEVEIEDDHEDDDGDNRGPGGGDNGNSGPGSGPTEDKDEDDSSGSGDSSDQNGEE